MTTAPVKRPRDAPAARLAALAHHRWAIPALAELRRLGGAKRVTLAHRLGAGREALRPALDALIAQGLVRRNRGYGHPLRPEVLLTARGRRAATPCARLLRRAERHGLTEILLRKWSLPAVLALGREARFNALKAELPGVTARALTLALKGLQEAGLVVREVQEGYPPRPRYRLTPRGRALLPALSTLALDRV